MTLLAFLLGCVQSAEKAETVTAGSLKLTLPAGWEVVEEASTLLSVLSPLEDDRDTFRENLRVTASEVQGAPTIDSLFTPRRKFLQAGKGKLIVDDHGALTCNGHRVLWMALRRKDPPADAPDYTMLQYGLVHDGKAYSLKFMSVASKRDHVRALAEAVLGTLQPPAGK